LKWIRAGSVEDIAIGDVVAVSAAPSPIALYRLSDGFYATQDTCTHAVASLSDGYLEDDMIECPLHAARFCVRTGAAKSYPAVKPLTVYPVRIEDQDVFVGFEEVLAL
jgi:nitrite reductase/ring-hydroxylating ferredoxin subunit